MIFSNLVTPEFCVAAQGLAQRLSINVDHLMAVMWSESRLNPQAQNPQGGATGLIQFMPATARGLGTSCSALLAMSGVEQLTYVEKFFRPYASRCHTVEDLYLACFFPVAIGKPDTYTLQTSTLSAALIARQNPIFDLNKDGKITVAEFRQHLKTRFPNEVRPFLF